MTVAPVDHVTDPDHVGVHAQDDAGLCLSLGPGQPWVHLSWTCLEALAKSILTTHEVEGDLSAPWVRLSWTCLEAFKKKGMLTEREVEIVALRMRAYGAEGERDRLLAIARFWKHRFMNTDQYTQDCTCPTCQTLTEETAEVPE